MTLLLSLPFRFRFSALAPPPQASFMPAARVGFLYYILYGRPIFISFSSPPPHSTISPPASRRQSRLARRAIIDDIFAMMASQARRRQEDGGGAPAAGLRGEPPLPMMMRHFYAFLSLARFAGAGASAAFGVAPRFTGHLGRHENYSRRISHDDDRHCRIITC